MNTTVGEARENVFTQFARGINDFANHKITKLDLYNLFTNLLEISTEQERQERIEFFYNVDKLKGQIVSEDNFPYSNWNKAREIIDK